MKDNNRREELERAIFILECKDRWNTQDYIDYNRMCTELR